MDHNGYNSDKLRELHTRQSAPSWWKALRGRLTYAHATEGLLNAAVVLEM